MSRENKTESIQKIGRVNRFINGIFKECRVVLLPTENAEYSYIIDRRNIITYCISRFTQEYLKSIDSKSYHLYILSDDEIKEDYWCYGENRIVMYLGKDSGVREGYYNIKVDNSTTESIAQYIFSEYKTIISTTNNKLTYSFDGITFKLAKPSKEFINHFVTEYNKGNIIDKVLVQYEEYISENYNPLFPGAEAIRLKVNSDNTINIQLIKDSWTKTELQVFNSVDNQNHLRFIYNRLINVHGENKNYDYMIKLKSICDFVEDFK